VDAVHAHDLDTLAAGVELRKRLGAKLVFDAHEIWAYMVAKDLPSPVWPHFLRVERRLVPHADMVLTVSEPLAEHFRALTTAPVEIILNAKQPTGRFVEPKVPFRAVHIGGLNPTRMTLGILDAFDGLSDAELLLAGVGAPGFIAHVQERAARLANVRYLGKIPMADVLMQTLAGHVVVCPFDPSDPLTRIGMPNKLFEALACGRPLITTTDTYLGALVEELEIGIACGFDAASLRAAIEELRDDKMSWRRMAKRAHALGKGEYGWPRQAQRLNELYAALLKVQS
jgi:glycosyltransferase involved in cell wall biosynthesis